MRLILSRDQPVIENKFAHTSWFGMPFCPPFEALKPITLCASPSHVVCRLDKTRSLTPLKLPQFKYRIRQKYQMQYTMYTAG